MVSAFSSPGFSIGDPNRTRSDDVERNAPAPAQHSRIKPTPHPAGPRLSPG